LSGAAARAANHERKEQKIAMRKKHTAGLEGQAAVIGATKQLFLDDSLIESMDGVRLVLEKPRGVGNALILPDEPWEIAHGAQVGAYSSVLEDGDRVRTWYFATAGEDQMQRRVCYAESDDGIHFTKPPLGLHEMGGTTGNSAVIADPIQGACVWIDPKAPPECRYRTQAKWGPFPGQSDVRLVFYASPDGTRWERTHEVDVGPCDTQNVACWDQRCQRYVLYTRDWAQFEDIHLNYRQVRRLESDDLVQWDTESIVWEADDQDLSTWTTCTGQPPVDYYGACVFWYAEAELYIMLAQAFWHWKRRPEHERWGACGDPETAGTERLAPAAMDVRLGWSRDGRRFRRCADRGPWLGLGPEGSFDSRRVWAMPFPIRMDDELWVYYTGENRDHDGLVDPAADGHLSGIGRATTRLDGFVAAEAGFAGGELVTRPLRFEGQRLELNADTGGGGWVRVELQDENGRPLEGFSARDSIPISGNSVRLTAAWGDAVAEGTDVSSLAHRPVRVRFLMRDCRLYAYKFRH